MNHTTLEVFPWNNSFETGIPQIDEQHKRLINLLNLLASHLAYQSDMLVLDNIFKELAEYAIYHFKSEGQVWHQYFGEDDEWGFQHKKEHESFLVEVLKLKEEGKGKTFSAVIEDLLSFLTHWLAFHIVDSDKRMAKVVLGMINSNLTLEIAKQEAELEMSGSIKTLIDIILTMYDSLSNRTLQLVREVTERQKAEEKLRLTANVFNNTLDAICITDHDFKVVEANPSFYQVTHLSEEDVMGKNLCLLKSGLLNQKQIEVFWESLHKSGHWSGVVHSNHKTGKIEIEWLTLSLVKNEEGAITNYVAIFSNVSHLIKKQKSLEKMAHHDMLTGLPNRLLLNDRLKMAIAHAEHTQTMLAICYVDLDGFKTVNDQLGHVAGDELLQETARRFLKAIRSQDTIARLGGDEFIILLGDLQHIEEYEKILNQILKDISQPLKIKNKKVTISASIGVTLFPQDNSEPDTLLQHADQAMYEAKKQGKSRYFLFTNDISSL
jgi:diguanylate cyclase (GGDEF)-like protein/hemerythrin-like metal-binding protein/PAS domain S-box-containing protein